jgi:hypothetical protein
VNRQGDLRLMFYDFSESQGYFVEYVPWTIDEEIDWNRDITSLEIVMKNRIENFEVAAGTEEVVQEAFRLASSL